MEEMVSIQSQKLIHARSISKQDPNQFIHKHFVMSHECHRVLKHRKLECYLNCSAKLTAKKTKIKSMLCIAGLLWDKLIDDRRIPLTMG